MELMDRGDLKTFLSRLNSSLSEKKAAAILRSVLSATKYLHKHRVIHRDLKPGK